MTTTELILGPVCVALFLWVGVLLVKLKAAHEQAAVLAEMLGRYTFETVVNQENARTGREGRG